MKHEWRKAEKAWYLPKEPTILTLPRLNFITLEGTGDPNGPLFSEQVGPCIVWPTTYAWR